MARIEIHDLGPITDCEMGIDNFTILTGAQASGKSTIAKSVFFCKTVKDDIYDAILKSTFLGIENSLLRNINRILRNKFLQLFGTSRAMKPQMNLKYFYNNDTYINVSLMVQDAQESFSSNLVWIEFSKNIEQFICSQEGDFNHEDLKQKLNILFDDEQECIFIPAGRSLITLLTSQLNYLLATMDDEQKRSIDFCTQKYIERILKIRPLFNEGIEGLIEQKRNTPGVHLDYKTVQELLALVEKVLKGKYMYKDNEERLYMENGHFVKINYTSSGQQETVWIFNILLHLILNKTKVFLILEEPEAHLYPQAQKHIVELLALAANKAGSVLLTTHSPYILGALNNLIYAEHLAQNVKYRQRVLAELPEEYHVKECYAYFLKNGGLYPCIEEEGLIINEVIDGASSEINEMYDKLFDIEYGGGVVKIAAIE